MQVRFPACNDKQHSKRTEKSQPPGSLFFTLMLSFPCLSSSPSLAVFPFLLLFLLPSFPCHFISSPPPSLSHLLSPPSLPSLSLSAFTSVFPSQWMRDGGQLVDAGVSKILSAHSSFENRSRSRTPIIFPLHPSQDYIWQPHIWEGERSAQSLHPSPLPGCFYIPLFLFLSTIFHG